MCNLRLFVRCSGGMAGLYLQTRLVISADMERLFLSR
jgi:hypothetical protein